MQIYYDTFTIDTIDSVTTNRLFSNLKDYNKMENRVKNKNEHLDIKIILYDIYIFRTNTVIKPNK